jgi:hypothetical protein
MQNARPHSRHRPIASTAHPSIAHSAAMRATLPPCWWRHPGALGLIATAVGLFLRYRSISAGIASFFLLVSGGATVVAFHGAFRGAFHEALQPNRRSRTTR